MAQIWHLLSPPSIPTFEGVSPTRTLTYVLLSTVTTDRLINTGSLKLWSFLHAPTWLFTQIVFWQPTVFVLRFAFLCLVFLWPSLFSSFQFSSFTTLYSYMFYQLKFSDGPSSTPRFPSPWQPLANWTKLPHLKHHSLIARQDIVSSGLPFVLHRKLFSSVLLLPAIVQTGSQFMRLIFAIF